MKRKPQDELQVGERRLSIQWHSGADGFDHQRPRKQGSQPLTPEEQKKRWLEGPICRRCKEPVEEGKRYCPPCWGYLDGAFEVPE